MRRGLRIILVIVIGAVQLAACTSSMTGRVEMDHGTSYQLALHNQILNPDAEKNLAPVYGFEGAAAQATLEKYDKSFSKETQAPVYSINIGGSAFK